MILFSVKQGIVTALSVAKETKTGWRRHNNGFINRSVPGKYPDVEATYYTTSKEEAFAWSQDMVSHMRDLISLAGESRVDIELWSDRGQEESDLPQSRRK